jgi:glutamine amidotransferase
MTKIVVADLGTGNLRSVSKALTFVSSDADVSISADTNAIEGAEYLVLPGQGAIGTWFNQINTNAQLKTAIVNRLQDGPVLGICLGLQALYSTSEENGGTEGLGLLAGRVKHFSSHPLHDTQVQGVEHSVKLKIPHMGWNQVNLCSDHPLWHGIDDKERFYFVHSFYVESENRNQVMGECEYGNKFTAAAGSKNIFATQFHPEKSQHAGLQLLKNFINWNGVS